MAGDGESVARALERSELDCDPNPRASAPQKAFSNLPTYNTVSFVLGVNYNVQLPRPGKNELASTQTQTCYKGEGNPFKKYLKLGNHKENHE